MRERKASNPDQFWRLEPGRNMAFVVTTNAMTRKDGTAVMGGGIARQAAELMPDLPRELGLLLRQEGNQPYIINGRSHTVVTMPTKQDWRDPSPMELVVSSAKRVAELAYVYRWDKVHAPQPGCGLGGLDWEEVKQELAGIWNDKFIVWSL